MNCRPPSGVVLAGLAKDHAVGGEGAAEGGAEELVAGEGVGRDAALGDSAVADLPLLLPALAGSVL